jgi:hypothetical protein
MGRSMENPEPTKRLTPEQANRLAQWSAKVGTAQLDHQRIAIEIQLRQWCVEKAIEAMSKIVSPVPVSVSSVAADIYRFVALPLGE